MGSYVQQSLVGNERVVASAKLHWIAFLWPFSILSALSTELAVTDKRVIAKTGLISRKTIEQRLAKVDAIRVNQGILGRILGYGTIIVSGSGMSAEGIKNIANPLAFKRAVEEQIQRHEDEARAPVPA